MDRSSQFQAQQGLTLYFLGKLHSGLKKLSAYYRQRGVKVFNITTPEELERAMGQSTPHALVIDLQSRTDITSFFDVLGQYEGLLELPRVAIISSTTDKETADALISQADEAVIWPLKATDLSLKMFNLLSSRGQFVRFQRDARNEDGHFFRGELYDTFLRDVLQLLFIGRKDCILSLECEGRRGNLYFKEGKLIDAQVGALEWEDSLRQIRRFKGGTFVLSFQPVDRKRFIEKNVAAWLAQQDEEADFPPLTDPGEATAVEEGHDPEATVPRAILPSSAQMGQRDYTGVILGGAAAMHQESERPRADSATPASAPVTSTPDPLLPPEPTLPSKDGRDSHGYGSPRQEVSATSRSSTGAGRALEPRAERSTHPQTDLELDEEGAQPGGNRRFAAVALLMAIALGGFLYVRSRPSGDIPVAGLNPTPSSSSVSATQESVAANPAPRIKETITTEPAQVADTTVPKAPVREIVERIPAPSAAGQVATTTVLKATPTVPPPSIKPIPAPATTKAAPTPPPVTVASVPTPVPAAPVPVPVVSQPPVQVPEVLPRAEARNPDPVALESAEDRPERFLRKGRELEKAGKLQEALTVYNRAAEIDPTSREAAEAILRLKSLSEPSPTAPGELFINSYPYGIVYIDGEKHGYTPVHLRKAIPRKYLIRVVNPELGACTAEVVVKPGEREIVQLRLDDSENCTRSRTP